MLDSEDFLVSNLLLPIGSLIYLLFCVTKWGWGADNYFEEVNTGVGIENEEVAEALLPVHPAHSDFDYSGAGTHLSPYEPINAVQPGSVDFMLL